MGGAQAFEVKAYAIGDFTTTCGGNDISHWPDMVDEWYDEMASHGHLRDGQYTDGSMSVLRFCDYDQHTSCRDYEHIDDADAVIIATHGSDSGDHWRGTMRVRRNDDCHLDGGGSGTNMYVGDVDLEFVHLSSCYSADDDNLSGIRRALTDPVDGGFAHQWLGFHGIMWIGGGFDNDYEDAADDGHSVAITSAWVENHYRNNSVDCDWYDPFNWFGTCQDQCPVGYAISSNRDDVIKRRDHERYNHVYADPSGNSWYGYRYIAGCDPVGETAFNP